MENKVIAKEYINKNYIKITEMIKVMEDEKEKDYISENGWIALTSIIDYLKEKMEDNRNDVCIGNKRKSSWKR